MSTSASPTPTPTPTATPTPTPSSTAPLSPFEKDPAVKALRRWAAQAARTVNTGHYTDSALAAVMTGGLAKNIKVVLGPDVGLYYPGPAPFTPVSVRTVSATRRDVKICIVGTGFAEKRSTKRPAAARKVLAIDAGAVRVSGRWVASQFYTATFSCSGVTVPEPRWS